MKKAFTFLLVFALIVLSVGSFAMAEDNVHITWWMQGSGPDEGYEMSAQQAIAKAFMEQNPGIEVETVFAGPSDEYQKKIVMMAANDELPDLFNSTAANVQGFKEANVMTDITEYIDADEEWLGYFIEGAWDAHIGMTGGAKCGVPYQTEAQGWFYNKKLFEDNGLTIPTTFEEFKNAVTVLLAAGIQPIAHGGSDLWAVWGYYPFFARYGLGEVAEGLKTGDLKWADVMVAPFERIKDLADLGAYPANVTTMDNTQAKEMFLSGNAAMYTTGTWEMASFAAADIADQIVFNWGPTFDDSEYEQKVGLKSTHWSVWVGSSVGKDEAKLAAVLKLLKFAGSPEMTKMAAEEYGQYPATTYDMSSSTLPAIYIALFDALADDYVPCSEVPFYFDAALQEPIWNSITSVISSVITPEEAALQLDDA